MIKIEQWILDYRPLAGALLMALVVGSCTSSTPRAPSSPPSNQDNICAIFDERPDWQTAITASAIRWGAPVEVQMAIIWKESNFRAKARTQKTYAMGFIPTGRASSAYGFAQAIDGTWDWYRRETGNSGADRDNFEDAADFIGWYMTKTMMTNGIRMQDAFNQYLAYHEGQTGYSRGSWQKKDWLKRTASQVAERAMRYRGQLRRCPYTGQS
jgi:hypothetical protein